MEELVIVEKPSPKKKERLKRVNRPPLYRVLLLNDDYTPMDFVVLILVRFFNHSEETAIQTMLKVHYEHKAVCGIYTHDIALTKMDLVCRYAREYQHPLTCTIEEDE